MILLAACAGVFFTWGGRVRAISSNIVISQVYGGGGNSGATLKNDFIELFNAGTTAVDVTGWSVQYASASGNSWSNKTALSGVIQPGHYYLVQEAAGSGGTQNLPTPDATGTINMSGSSGKVALVSSSATLTAPSGGCPSDPAIVDLVSYGGNCGEGNAPAPGVSNTTAAWRNGSGCTDTDNNANDFTIAAPSPRNSASEAHNCSVVSPTNPTGVGLATPASVLPGASTLLTVAVTPGAHPPSTSITVAVDLAPIGGGVAQLLDDGTNGDVTSGDGTYSVRASIPSTPAFGTKTLTATIADAQGRSSTATIALVVEPALSAIHEIQGNGDVSPLANQTVTARGIVTGVKVGSSKGFFLQARDEDADADETTSEGVFVYTGSSLPAPAVGDEVKVVGQVKEYYSLTEIAASAVTKLSSGNVLPSPVQLGPTLPSPGGAFDQLERYEGMRVSLDSLTVVGPTGLSSNKSNGMFFGVASGIDRPFREPGIDVSLPALAGMPDGAPRFDTNPERLQVDSDALGLPALDVASGAVVAGLVGPLDYVSGAYTIDPEVRPAVKNNGSAKAVPEVPAGQFTVASFNLLHFADTGDTAFQGRLQKASAAIRTLMRLPDIIGVQEVVNLPALQALADKVNADAAGGARLYSAYLEEGNDPGGIDVGFLVKSSVTVDSVTQVGKDEKFIDPRDGSSDTLNDRPPLVLRGTIADPRGGAFPITVVVNHLRSLIDVDADTPSGVYARAKRRAGAESLAKLLQQHQLAGEHVVSVGDYNAFQFNDGYVDVLGTILGAPARPDQVLLPSPDLVGPNFADLVNTDVSDPAERYSYVEAGNAQVLDHVVVSPNMLARAVRLAYARVNSDFPEIYATDVNRPERVSDHDPAVAYFTFPTADVSVAQSAQPNPVLSGNTIDYSVTLTNGAADPAVGLRLVDTFPGQATSVRITPPTGWTCTPSATSVECTADELAGGASATIEFLVTFGCNIANGTVATNTAAASTQSFDSDESNNSSTVTASILNTAPEITAVAATPGALWPPNHQLVPVHIDYSVRDNCDPTPACSLEVTSSEAADAGGDGHTAVDWKVVDSESVMLRAERSASGGGRTYTVGIACTDASGYTGTKAVNVFVPKSQK